jgi:hypothetical protein
VNGAEGIERLPRQRLNLVALRNVGTHRDHARISAEQLTLDRGERILPHVGQNDLHPLRRELLRHRPPDATSRPRDHSHPVLKLLHP